MIINVRIITIDTSLTINITIIIHINSNNTNTITIIISIIDTVMFITICIIKLISRRWPCWPRPTTRSHRCRAPA